MVIDDVFAVIAEGTRRAILGSLRSGDKAVGELVDELSVSQPTVSKHLKVLREAGLVEMRAQGQKRFYSLNTEPLGEVTLWIRGFEPPPEAPAAAPRLSVAEAAAAVPSSGLDISPARPVLDGGTVADPSVQQQFGRTVGRAAEKAADLIAQFPKLRRRRE